MSAIGRGMWAAVAFAAGMASLAAPTAHAQWDREGTVYCASDNGRFVRCRTPWPQSQLSKQVSDTRCIYGQTWGNDRGSVWVDKGCRANFEPARGGGWGGGWGGDRPGWGGDRPGWDDDRPGWGDDRPVQVRCDSNGNRLQYCPVDLGRGGRVRLIRRLSDSRCNEGESWGWDRRGIWVNNGCRAIFQVDRRW
ncbi:DUF3011 domain-containing protein [Dyella sp. BiH032]|uniref:DUF3011 domain-containing protein n=1 Tax=Dyella sp. BiH032 TaxID=3075430 RepID=UPI0028931AEA|nr:DUF3011 domain-containing protein [Dyella sp. BiH032]WNL45435.1 DUF3011 domain-containing protein [Dyella sp. BiH032]